MAYTSVIPVRRLDRAVKYVINKEKTTAVSLQDALDYAANRDKTEQSCFESSYACTLETAFADILANEIYCGAKGYPAIISKEVYSQAASIRSNKTVTYSAVLKPFRSDMQCACCGERLYWRPRTQQWTCRQCGMWSKPMQPENMAQQIVDRLYQIQQHPEIIHNPKEQCNTRSIEVAQLDHEIHTALALPELDADAIIDKILRRAELQFNYCAAGDDDPTTMQIKRACKEFKPTDTFPESFYSSIVSKIILHLDTHIDIKLRNGQTL